MKLDLFQDPITDAMGNYMTRLSKRQQVVASNLANIDTPGYRTQEVSFHATMEELLGQSQVQLRVNRGEQTSTPPMAFAPPEPEVFEVRGLPVRADQNNVDLDRELLKLGETSFGYALMAQLLRGKFRTLSNAINEGRTA